MTWRSLPCTARAGEDGMTQHVLEFLGIPYTGSSPLASGIAMDKDLSKLLYARAGLPIAPSITFGRDDMPSIEEIVAIVGPELREARRERI